MIVDFLQLILAPILSFLVLMFAVAPLERAFPAKPEQPIFRKAWRTDLAYLFGQYLLWTSLVSALMLHLRHALQFAPLTQLHGIVASLPIWLQITIAILVSDLVVYWGHRFQHRFNFLWRFHKIHHTAEHLDWLAAHREHPLDTVYTATMINLPWILMGFDTIVISGLLAFRGVWAIYIHSNIRINHGPIRWFIGAPELHHWHHDLERDRGNYANLSPLMDLAFGTYTCPDHEPAQLGLSEPVPKSYLGQLLHPVAPSRALNLSALTTSDQLTTPEVTLADAGSL